MVIGVGTVYSTAPTLTLCNAINGRAFSIAIFISSLGSVTIEVAIAPPVPPDDAPVLLAVLRAL